MPFPIFCSSVLLVVARNSVGSKVGRARRAAACEARSGLPLNEWPVHPPLAARPRRGRWLRSRRRSSARSPRPAASSWLWQFPVFARVVWRRIEQRQCRAAAMSKQSPAAQRCTVAVRPECVVDQEDPGCAASVHLDRSGRRVACHADRTGVSAAICLLASLSSAPSSMRWQYRAQGKPLAARPRPVVATC